MMEAETRMDRWKNALREEHQKIFDYDNQNLKQEFAEYVNCPVCESSNSKLWFEKDFFKHVRCNDCSMVYLNPRMNDAATISFYNGSVNAIYNETKFDEESCSTQLDDEINLGNLHLLQEARKDKKGNLLEIGSAKGFFLQKAQEAGYSVYGLELNQKNYELSKKRLGDTIFNKTLSEVNFDDKSFDVIYMRDVIEHIPNPKDLLVEMHRILKSDGVVFLETHNVDGWIHRIAGAWHTVFFGFEHPLHWSVKTLSKVLSDNGFKISKVKQISLDFTLSDVLSYLITPGFTTIYPKLPNKAFIVSVKIARRVVQLPVLRWLDRKMMPAIANFFGYGSVMKIIAHKTEH
jgi:2-polyprenyl-3-methyl-5-hydroxy-6-metoxy-1,4-benzoquinol methylase